MTDCTIITELAGVRFPRRVVVYDCRAPADRDPAEWRAPWGETLWGSERATLAHGLRSGYGSADRHDVFPHSCQTYRDLRTASAEALAEVALRMIEAFQEQRRRFRRAEAEPAPPDEGGAAEYEPVALVLCNYGWDVLCDRRRRAVRRLG